MGPGGYDMGWMWLWVLLVLVGVLAVVVGLVAVGRSGTRAGGSETPGSPSARQILDERFARGEIDDEEYRARRRALDER